MALKNTVLAIPNSNDIRLMAKEWLRIVREETLWTQLVRKAGIPALDSQAKILKFAIGEKTFSIPTYVSTDFNSFDNAFVLEETTPLNSYPEWVQPLQDMDLSGYIEAFKALWSDVCIMCRIGLNPSSDTMNSIIVREGNKWHSGGSSPLEVRAFPFDFTSKVCKKSLPVSPLTLGSDERIFKYFLADAIDYINPKNFKDQDKLIESILESINAQFRLVDSALTFMGIYALTH